MGPQAIFKSWFKYHLLNLSTRWLHAIASTSGRQWSWWMWLQGDQLITHPWPSHSSIRAHSPTGASTWAPQLVHTSTFRSALEPQLLPFTISLRPSQEKKTSLFLFGIFVWQLCELVVEQSKEALKLLMMWKSQLCSSSVVMKLQPFRLNFQDLGLQTSAVCCRNSPFSPSSFSWCDVCGSQGLFECGLFHF